VVTDRPLPKLTWNLAGGADGGDSTLTLSASPVPVAARIWSATSATRDFRESQWQSSVIQPGETITYHATPPKSGHLAFFGELEYQIDGITYHLTTSFQEPGAPPPNAAAGGK
jgi:PhoPQ-activated pathogenicity-related protein